MPDRDPIESRWQACGRFGLYFAVAALVICTALWLI